MGYRNRDKRKLKKCYMIFGKLETKEAAEKAFELFVETYDAKHPKAMLCLQKDSAELLAFYDFPAPH